ncbi:MAG: 50S ribosomal protein L32 [Candidatus Latescibacteria bacterium]|jgi:large subunit ribosomal protein L32|nr:50S ribosomal protein L32 [Candidatus Latescibacterota bacterium]
MANPKRRSSNSRTGKRRAHWKLSAPGFSECPNCGQPRRPHRVCSNCGHYNSREATEGEAV